MTELEERLLTEVTRLEAGMNDLSEQLTAINGRLDVSTKLIKALQSGLSNFLTQQQNFSEAQQKLSSPLEKLSSPQEKLQAHLTSE